MQIRLAGWEGDDDKMRESGLEGSKVWEWSEGVERSAESGVAWEAIL